MSESKHTPGPWKLNTGMIFGKSKGGCQMKESEFIGSSVQKEIDNRTGKDLYSQVAIDVNKLEGQYTADKKAPNFLKKPIHNLLFVFCAQLLSKCRKII